MGHRGAARRGWEAEPATGPQVSVNSRNAPAPTPSCPPGCNHCPSPGTGRTRRSARGHPPPIGAPAAQAPAPPPPRRKSRGPSLRPPEAATAAAAARGRESAQALQLGDLSTPFLSPNGGGDDGERGPGGESPTHTRPTPLLGTAGKKRPEWPRRSWPQTAVFVGEEKKGRLWPLLPLGRSAVVQGTAGGAGGRSAFRGAPSEAGPAVAAFPAKTARRWLPDAQFQADSVPALLPQPVGELRTPDARVPRRPREGVPKARLSLPGGRAPRRAGTCRARATSGAVGSGTAALCRAP